MEQMALMLQGDTFLLTNAQPYQYPIENFQLVFLFVNIEYYDNVCMSHL